MSKRWLILLVIFAILALIPLPRALAQSPADAVVEREFKTILAKDNAAMTEVHQWFHDNLANLKKSTEQRTALGQLVQQRLTPVRTTYEDFLAKNPEHTRARNAYASFLSQSRNDKEAASQWEIALELDPKSAVAWNNLGVHFGNLAIQLKELEPAQRAIANYIKAAEVAPREPLYLHNLATAIALFRDAAAEHFKIDRAQVLDRALEFYRKALDLDPKRFQLAAELAETYHDIRPIRVEEARRAWTRALQNARDDSDREWVNLQLALLHANAGDLVSARQQFAKASGKHYAELHLRLAKALGVPIANVTATNAATCEFKIELRRADDKIESVSTADQLVLSITVKSGIGGATVKKSSGVWPASVSLRINRPVLESFGIGNGTVTINGAAYAEQQAGRWHLAKGKTDEGELLPANSPLQLRVRKHGDNGMEIELPKALLTEKTDTLSLKWIDRYR